MKKLIFLALIPILFSCEKTIKYELPVLPPRFSVEAHIHNDQPIKVFAARTEPALSSKYPQVVSDAQVLLIENDVPVSSLAWISTGDGNGYYQSSFTPSAGNKYRIEVSNQELGTAIGEATSFDPTEIIGYSLDTTNLELTLTFRDVKDSEDYYAINVYARSNNMDYPLFIGTTDPSVDFFFDYSDDIFGENVKSGFTAFLTDETFRNRTKTVKFTEVIAYGGVGRPEALILEVIRVSEDYYLYERSKGAQYTGGDNPFAEPVQIYTNIVNGYGIVAAGAPTRLIINI